ncbi:AAA family ATPase [Cocleimonas sp. KMM 6892]|uniref:AAA family ATPase n=1 Tax=unclassified Cocleimonas TaxID=2639732 RepID=UPI002DBD2C81|nr:MULTISPECIES: AAA family ATPase [unclassified Cocleimonas]MEB8430967.1 AAA family ATPase [Cocleimonas sp. KMM 6892]MEC4714261.1 AAA family ATPase [Cocleimonas sp. KMM 6895]MEC4743592.1 AAA family ATPase [Cocleimonas sp. KMM 6896]
MITVIGNLKGGTGKSTVAFNLSIWVATRRNVHVSVYDLDPQATITDALEIRTEDGHMPTLEPIHNANELGSEGKHTEVIVDIGISDNEAMNTALQRADRIVIPVAPSQADVWSTQRFLKLISNVRKTGVVPEIIGFMNRSDTHTAVRETDDAFDALNSLSGIKMIEPRLYQRTAYRRSFSEGMAVFEMDAKSKAAAEIEELGELLY